jgi:Ran GTPase-activating protein (RanGAP) involved in mRNA processing and transport
VLRRQSLKALEEWAIDKNDSWTSALLPATPDASNVLSNELHAILSSNPGLQRLDLTDCQIGSSSGSKTINSSLNILGLSMRNGNCGVSSIAIGKNSMTKADLHSLLAGIRSCPTALVELDVHECGLDDEQVAALLTTLLSERPERLQLLDISAMAKDPHPHHSHYRHQQRQGLSDTIQTTGRLNMATIQSLLQRCKRLSVLRLRGYNLALDRHLLDVSRLRELDLGYNRLGTSGVEMLCQWMQTPSFNSVEALHVNGCGLDGRHLQSLLLHITVSGNRQVHLNAGSNPVWREVMYIPKLCNALMQGEGPCSLSLAKTDWEDGTLREFLDCIRDNHTIMVLDLSDIRVTGCDALSDDTVRVLASVFERNTAIRDLKLNITSARSKEGCARIGKGIVDALDVGLKHNRVLERLELNGIGMGDVGAAVLANAITTNRVLKSIHLDENKVR